MGAVKDFNIKQHHNCFYNTFLAIVALSSQLDGQAVKGSNLITVP